MAPGTPLTPDPSPTEGRGERIGEPMPDAYHDDLAYVHDAGYGLESKVWRFTLIIGA